MSTIRATDVSIKDAFFAASFVALSVATLYFGMRASQAELEARQLREHDAVLGERLAKLDAAYQTIRSYTNTAQALASPELAVQARHGDPFVAPTPSLEDMPLVSAFSFAERRSDVDRFMARLQQIDAMQENTERLARRLGGLADLLKREKSTIRAIPSIMPVEGLVSSEFGVRLSPFEGKRHMHAGIDIAADVGATIVAPADGTVTFVGEFEDMGRSIVIDHGNGILSRYGHTSKALAREGQKVKRGQEIALVGNTGRSTGPHLHYEIWVNNNPVNPREFFFDLGERPEVGVATAAPTPPEQLPAPTLKVAGLSAPQPADNLP